MLRKISIAIILAMVIITLVCQIAVAQNVAVKASPFIVEPPESFVVETVSDYEVILTWGLPTNASSVMVRAGYGRMPQSITDGYLVYYGSEETATDWVNMESMSVPVYYRAFSQRASDGMWEIDGSTGRAESDAMQNLADSINNLSAIQGDMGLLIFELVFILALFALAVYRRDEWLYLITAIPIFGIGLQWYQTYPWVSVTCLLLSGLCIYKFIINIVKSLRGDDD